MKRKYYLLLLLPLIPIAILFFKWSAEEAQKTSKEILTEFKKVNESVKYVPGSAEDRIELLCDSLAALNNYDSVTAMHVDLLIGLKDRYKKLENKLKQKYPAEPKDDSLMVISLEDGKKLYEQLTMFYQLAHSNLKSEGKREELRGKFKWVLDIKDASDFTRRYFENMPVIAIHTLLSKFRNDIESGTEMTLADILNEKRKASKLSK